MRAAAAFLVGFLVSSTALAEPHPLPPGVSAAWVVEGTARLRLDGAAQPDSHLTLLPGGVYITEDGYKALTDSTLRLQRDVATLKDSLAAHQSGAVVTSAPVLRTGWSTRTLLWALFGGVVLGGGVVYVAGGGR